MIKSALMFAGMLGAASLALAQTQTSPSYPSSGGSTSSGTTSTPSTGTSTGSSTGMSSGTTSGTTGHLSHKSFLKECMHMGKEANNGMSEEDMKKACHSQLKQYESGAISEPSAPQPTTSSSSAH